MKQDTYVLHVGIERAENPPPYPHYALSRHSDGYELIRYVGLANSKKTPSVAWGEYSESGDVVASSATLSAMLAALRLIEAQTVWRFTQRGDHWDMAPMRFDDQRLAIEGDGR